MSKDLKHFNIRVYGILLNQKKEVMISDEFVLNTYMTKFPGGGLKFGEGPEDCLKRECIEEFGQEIEIREHFYTTGSFQKALFYPDHQLISIYYLIDFLEEPKFKISTKAFDFSNEVEGSQSFRWVGINGFDLDELNFPLDKFVFKLLKDKYL